MKKKSISIRKAKMSDVRSIHGLLNYFADRRELLPRSLSDIYENLQQFFVAIDGKKIVGTCALYITWVGLAEVKALAVRPTHQGKGLGKRLLQTAVQEARKLGVEQLFTLTIREALFKKFGFKRTKKNQLPHKVWTECVQCPYFPDACIETSLTLNLKMKKGKNKKHFTHRFMTTSQSLVPSEPVVAPLVPPPPPHRVNS